MATGRRRGRAIFYIAFILILIVVLAVVVVRFNPLAPQGSKQVVSNAAATMQPTKDTVEIVMTTQDVRRGQALEENLLALVPIPRENFTDEVFFTKVDQVVGSRAKMDLKAHTPLTKALLFSIKETGSVPSFEIPAGKVAISVPISKLSSVAYGLQKGDHVNVIASLLMVDLDTNFQSRLPNRTGIVIAPGPISEDSQSYVTALVNSPEEYKVNEAKAMSYMGRIEIDPTMNNPVYVIPGEKQRPRLVSQTLIQDVVILQLGTFTKAAETTTSLAAPVTQPGDPTATRPATSPNRASQQAAAETTQLPDVVTVIVSPQDAVTLNYLMLAGANLNMVLRSAGDSEVKNTEAVTLQFILDQYQIPNPAKLPYGVEPNIETFPEFIKPFPEPSILATPTKANQ